MRVTCCEFVLIIAYDTVIKRFKFTIIYIIKKLNNVLPVYLCGMPLKKSPALIQRGI